MSSAPSLSFCLSLLSDQTAGIAGAAVVAGTVVLLVVALALTGATEVAVAIDFALFGLIGVLSLVIWEGRGDLAVDLYLRCWRGVGSEG